MANDPTRQVQDAFHPSGHPNKTPVNAENPIFGRPAELVITQDSIEQAAVVQSEKHPRETVQSPLINEDIEHTGSGSERYGKADDWTRTVGAGLTADTSSADTGAEYTHGSGSDSSKVTPVVPVELPTQEQADAIAAQAAAEIAQRKFSTGEKVTFSPESGNDTTEVYTIDGGEIGGGDALGSHTQWFWRLVEKPGSLFLGSSLQATSASVA